ncbi:GIY-YIG catalytic domain protein [compost metagenome]
MASIYVLFSKTLNRFYIGSCAQLNERLAEHLNKTFAESFTAKANDWELFLSIENLSYKEARFIEIHIKKMKSNVYIKNLKRYPEMISNLVEKYKVA